MRCSCRPPGLGQYGRTHYKVTYANPFGPRLPSVKALVAGLRWTPAQAQAWRSLARGGGHATVDRMLTVANGHMDGSGVEAIRGGGGAWDRHYMDIRALYVNMGDTYSTTLLYDVARDTFYITSWGDWVETAERTRRYRFE